MNTQTTAADALDDDARLFRDKWTDNQRCPQCGQDPNDCDYCYDCDLQLLCAQGPEGLTAATLVVEADGTRILVLAVETDREPWWRPVVER